LLNGINARASSGLWINLSNAKTTPPLDGNKQKSLLSNASVTQSLEASQFRDAAVPILARLLVVTVVSSGHNENPSSAGKIADMADLQGEAGLEHETKAITVLVVEDEALMRTKLAEELQDAGYLVVEASDGTEAVEILTVRRDVKIVISDVRMPGPIDGVELCRRVRSGYPGIKVVLSSGESNAADSTPHDGFFLKPYRVARIIMHIRSFTG
jgi:two-component system, response regulator PdtaR